MNRAQLVAELKMDEGLRLTAYDDATGKPLTQGSRCLGHPTIGIGRALDVHGITEAEALFLLNNDIDEILNQLEAKLPWFTKLDDARQRALCNMAFNLGVAGLMAFRETLSLAKAGSYAKAAEAIEDSAWYKQVGTRGERLAALMRGEGEPVIPV